MSISGLWKDLKSSQLDRKESFERSYVDQDWNVNSEIRSYISLYGNRYDHIRYDPPEMADSDFRAFPLYWFLGNALRGDMFKATYFMAVLIIYILAYK